MMNLPSWAYFVIGIILLDIYYLISFKFDKPVWTYRKLYNADLNLIEQNIMHYSGREFEVFLYHLYRLLGHEVELTPETNDMGRDLIIDKDTYVEAKAWHGDKLIGREILEKLIGSCAMDSNVQNALVITTGHYHQNAYNYAKKINSIGHYNLMLYTMHDIMQLVKKIDSSELLRVMGYDYRYWNKQTLQNTEADR